MTSMIDRWDSFKRFLGFGKKGSPPKWKSIESKFIGFIGQKVLVKEDKQTVHFDFGGLNDQEFVEYELDEQDAVITKLETEVKNVGLDHLRTWLPNTIGTMEFRADRMNVVIEKNGDAFEITRIYIG